MSDLNSLVQSTTAKSLSQAGDASTSNEDLQQLQFLTPRCKMYSTKWKLRSRSIHLSRSNRSRPCNIAMRSISSITMCICCDLITVSTETCGFEEDISSNWIND